ncbi:MAG: MCP four helix bundle domain-containing protein [Nitrospirae bacterium]|nr:MCP four helix bundle domain-containing protein [Nitrospirota bacterium]
MKFSDMKIAVRLGIGFGVVVTLLLIVGATGQWGLHTLSGVSLKIINLDAKISEYAAKARANVLGLRRFEKDLFINMGHKDKEKEYFEKWTKEHENLEGRLQDVDKVVIDQKDKAAVMSMRKNLAIYDAGFRKTVELINNGAIKTTQEANTAIAEYKNAIHEIEDSAKSLAENGVKRMEFAVPELNRTENKTVISMISLVAVAIAMAILLSVLIVKGILKQLGGEPTEVVRIADAVAKGDLRIKIETKPQDETSVLASMKEMVKNLRNSVKAMSATSESVASSSEELSATVHQMSGRVAEQSNRANQIATSTAEMSQTVIDIAKNASEIAASGNETLTIAAEGADVVHKTVDEVQVIAKSVGESSELITSLGDRSKQIGEVVTVIKDIADQTNLLALNAAIEAARAGEQGRGFAVVADEVRKLAERTAKATTEISDMINAVQSETDRAVSAMEESLRRVDSGVEFSTKAGNGLQKIVESVQSLQGRVQQIASATEEMSTVSDGIGTDLETVATVSRETSESVNGISRAANDLAKLSVDLKEEVYGFKL